MQNHNDNTIKTSNTDLRKIYLSLYWKGRVWEGVGNRTELQHTDPHSICHNRVSFPFPWAAQPEAWVPSLSGTCSSIQHLLSNSSDPQLSIGGLRAPSAGCWLSLSHLVTNWLNFLCTELYNSSTQTLFLWASQIAFIQSIHGQGYTLLFLDRMHLLFTQVHFLFCQPGRVVGQYTAIRMMVWGFAYHGVQSKANYTKHSQMVPDASSQHSQHYKLRNENNKSYSGKAVGPSPTFHVY